MASPVALVTMPWSSVRRASLALGILKRSLRRRRIAADVLYLNIPFARRMNLRDYEVICETHFVGDWLFAQHLFGPFGTAELKNDCQTVLAEMDRSPDSVGTEEVPLLRYLRDTLKIDLDQISRHVIPAFVEECLAVVPWGQYRIVGFTSVFAQQLASLLLAKRLKDAYPDLVIVFGGPNVHGTMGRTLLSSFDWVDYVIDGEGETVFPELVRRIIDGISLEEPLAGVSGRVGREIRPCQSAAPLVDVNHGPIPDFSDYFAALEKAGMPGDESWLAFEGSRGCWWGQASPCRFCGLNGERMSYRRKNPRRITKELLTLSRRHASLRFHASDNVLSRSASRDWASLLSSHALDLEICYEVRPGLDAEQLRRLRAAGLRHAQIGIESLNSDILRRIRKGVTAIDNVHSLKACCEAGITPVWNVLHGFPGDRPEEYRQMVETIPLLTHLSPPTGFVRLILQRFSSFFEEQQKSGFVDVTPAQFYHWIYPSKRVDLDGIAYYFDYSLADRSRDLDKWTEALRRSVGAWGNAFSRRRPVFSYRRGPGFVELNDTRPLPGRQGQGSRRTVLRGLSSDIFLMCRRIQPFTTLVQLPSAGRGEVPRDEEVARVLASLTSEGLMYAEGDRYVSLALPYDASKY